MIQGTLDMLILQTLVLGPAHGQTIAHAIERGSEEVLQVEHGSLYQPSTGSRTVVGSRRSGELRRITARRNITASPLKARNNSQSNPSGGTN
jgi:hypothetical protein